jgi:putative NADPH-quinone reductase
VYWQNVPAILKGWIDRVWNYGFAYGRSRPRLAGKRMLWLSLAGATADDHLVHDPRGCHRVRRHRRTADEGLEHRLHPSRKSSP